MSRKTRHPFVIALCWLACACGSDAATPTRRPGGPGSSSNGAQSGLPGANPGSGPSVAIDNGTAFAGSGAPLVPPTAGNTPHSGSGDPNVCEIVQLVANPQVPDMMIVLDRSGSMEDGGRWEPSVSAVRKITMQLQDRIRFGLAMFPDDGMNGVTVNTGNGGFGISFGDDSSCTPGKIVVPIAEKNAGPIGMRLDMTEPRGGTPTSETLMKVLSDYGGMVAGPDAEQHPKYVLLVTDGAPTCPVGDGSATTQEDIDSSNRAVEALTAAMVKTYVIGYDTNTAGNEMLAQVLDGFAQRGGTGDQMHRPVEDEASLTAALESITSSISSCSFMLDQAPARADFVLVTLDGRQLNLGDPNGWQMVGDRTVEIIGGACSTFKSGLHALDAKVQCTVVQPS